jgi:hypothetical protein
VESRGWHSASPHDSGCVDGRGDGGGGKSRIWVCDCDFDQERMIQERRACPAARVSVCSWQWQPSMFTYRTCVSWYTHGVTSLLGAAGVLGLELDGEGGPLWKEELFTELFLLRALLCAYEEGFPPCNELASEPCLLVSFSPLYSSPKKPCSFL